MSLGRRIFNIANHRLHQAVDWAGGLAEDRLRTARQELQEFLEESQRSGSQPGGQATGPGAPKSGSGATPGRPQGGPRPSGGVPPGSTRTGPPPNSGPRPGSSSQRPPRHPMQDQYELLGAPVGCALDEVQRCWRARVRETHPDRFNGDPARQTRASENLIRVNRAYEQLSDYLKR